MNDYTVQTNAAAHRFEATVEGRTAFAEYEEADGEIVFPHTVTPPELEGRGIASALAKAALAYARERGLKVVPACSFFAAYMKRHPETQDLLADGWRARLGR